MPPQDDDLMRLLDAIAECEPTQWVPELADVPLDRRGSLMGEAYRNGWITISSFRGDGSTLPGETLRLTAEGHAALEAARAAQDFDADHDGLDASERQRRRSQFMKALYEEVGDNIGHVVAWSAVGQRLRWGDAQTRPVVRYLASKGLVAYRALGGRIAITQAGVDEVERALARPAEPTEHLASMNVSIGEAQGPVQIVQGGRGDLAAPAATKALTPFWRRAVAAFRSWTGVIVLGAIGSLLAAVVWQIGQSDGHPTALLTIDNRVTNGPSDMREDAALRLVREPAVTCFQRPSCVIQDPQYGSGDRVTVTCQTPGDRVTNGSDNDHSDDANPGLFESTLWYGIEKGGQRMYVSEVWIDRHGRGGMGLPRCG